MKNQDLGFFVGLVRERKEFPLDRKLEHGPFAT